MPSLGWSEILIIGVLLLMVVGPQRLPYATRTLGRFYGTLRRSADELRRALVVEADRMDEEERLRDLAKKRRAAEARQRARAARAGEGEDTPVPQTTSGSSEEATDDAGELPDESEDVVEPSPATHGEEAGTESAEQPPAPDMGEPAPEGFTQTEWDELPDDVREVVRKRESS